MQRDFHYYCIAVLCRMAGYDQADTATIAYASQFVDDAKWSAPVTVGGVSFDPCRTAHRGIASFTWDVQSKVFMPFHFPPARPGFLKTGEYLVETDSPIARSIVEKAFADTSDLRLLRIGIALHTFADTWAHARFSGRHDPENDIESIRVLKLNGSSRLLLAQNIFLDFLPRIGHAEAGTIPDTPHLKWISKLAGKPLRRNNSEEFLAAARAIHRVLGAYSPHPRDIVAFEKIRTRLLTCFGCEEDLKQRCALWKRTFRGALAHLDYDPLAWRRDALGAHANIAIEENRSAELSFSGSRDFWDSPWVRFHLAARVHRESVLTLGRSAVPQNR